MQHVATQHLVTTATWCQLSHRQIQRTPTSWNTECALLSSTFKAGCEV